MMKKIKTLIITLFLFGFFIPHVYALETGSIKGTYSYDGTPFKDINVYLYQVADTNDEGTFTYLESYKNFELDINSLRSTEWQNYANTLNNYIKTNNINFNKQILTSETGNYEFKNLSKGLYLLIFDSLTQNDNTYTSVPTLISIPNFDDVTKTYIYDIKVNNKIELEPKEEPTTTSTTTTTTTKSTIIDVPQTSDNIMIYMIIFIISLIILLIISIYLFKLKKENEVNEKDEEIQ